MKRSPLLLSFLSINFVFLSKAQCPDNEYPTASNPSPVTINCSADIPAPDENSVIDEADNNGTPTVIWAYDSSDGQSCPETITRVYEITDMCGNSTYVQQLIFIQDDTPPTASSPAPIYVECIGDIPPANPSIVSDEVDNCTVVPVVVFEGDFSDGNTCPEIITRTYGITDDCGNQNLVTQTITIYDMTPPTASNPVTVNVESIGDVPAPDVTVVTDEADNCIAAPAVAFVSDVSNGNTCPEIITRTYSITDECGNMLLVSQEIIIGTNASATIGGNQSLIAQPANGTYRWLDCNNNYAAINGETGYEFYPQQNGSYAVEVNLYGCIDTSDCVNFLELSIQEESSLSKISIYPNPSFGDITINMNNSAFGTIQLFNIEGKLLQSLKYHENIARFTSLEQGVYFIRVVTFNNEIHQEKLIVLNE